MIGICLAGDRSWTKNGTVVAKSGGGTWSGILGVCKRFSELEFSNQNGNKLAG